MASWQEESRQAQVSAATSSAESTRKARLDVPGLVSEDAIESRRENLRHTILHDTVEATLQKSLSTKILPQNLVLASALDGVAAYDDAEIYLPGGLTFHDLNELTPVALPVLSPRFAQRLKAEMMQTLASVSEYLNGESSQDDEDSRRRQHALILHEQIRARRQTIAQKETSLEDVRSRVLSRIEQINQVQVALESKLTDALSTLPSQLQTTRAAQADVVSATIETALLKLSLVRARAHRALYGYAPAEKPSQTVSSAVNAACEKLRERQRLQQAETDELDRQILEYEGMLRLVDGRDGSFAQVVRDMARVKRETDECRKDLRRLGWTGDSG
ncbi:hypothetical protein C8Q74DRAFT_1245726 [Fomes fomentarius]|nr:hypothetical protein C8Q74DRAFT_1245726 [Fomes fomentarius]